MKNTIKSYLDRHFDQFKELNDKIWDFAEIKFEEYQSSTLQKNILRNEGFQIKENICSLNTAFVAEFGQGKPVVAILGEFDALPALSQEAGAFQRCEINPELNGHGCGHNTLGAASALAAVAVKEYLAEHQISATVRYYGCPAEEGGAGKAFMVRDGAFRDVDLAITWHPNYCNAVISGGSLANLRIYYKFLGTSSHAAAAPHLGRSALDAVELMNIGANFLREHIIPEARIHYAITDAGGNMPNVVQKEAEVLYAIRAPKIQELEEICDRVDKIAEGAALMTETSFEKRILCGYSNFISNTTIANKMRENFSDILPLSYTQEELDFAENFKKTIPTNEMDRILEEATKNIPDFLQEVEIREDILNKPISQTIYPAMPMFGSTDVGDVSHVIPTAQFFACCYAMGTPPHSWQIVSQGKSSLAHKGLYSAAFVLAKTAIDFYDLPELQEKVKQEFESKNLKYKSLLPSED